MRLWKRQRGENVDRRAARGEDEKIELEKGDFSAIFIAAVLVYGPFILAMIAVTLLVAWIFGVFG